MLYASYTKRIFSSLIDILLIYIPCIITIYICDINYGLVLKVSFLVNIIYHYLSYKTQQRSIGEKIVGLKMIFVKEVKSKDKEYLIKAFLLSIVYLPLSLPIALQGSIVTVTFSILYQLSPQIRQKRQMMWDLASNTAVIDARGELH